MAYNSQTGYYEYTTDTTTKPDGIYTAIITAHDKSGKNTTSNIVKFKLDNHAPILTVNYPLDGAFVEGLVMINVTAIDVFPALVNYTSYNVDNTGWVDTSILWNTTKIIDGGHEIKLRALDEAGHLTETTIKVIVDNHHPQCSINSPVSNQYIENVFTFRVTATDYVGIGSVKITVFGSTITMAYNSQTGYYEYTTDTTTKPDGTYNCSVRASDKSGKVTIASTIYFRIDNNPPVLIVNYPLNNEFVEGDIKINVTASDAFPPPTNYTMYNIDNTGWIPTTVRWNTTYVSDGVHEIKIRAIDDAGHLTQTKIEVIVDNNYPICAVNSPTPNQFVEGTFTFKITASDYVGIDYVAITVFNATVIMAYNSQTGYYEYTTDTTTKYDGTYNVTIVAYDKSGKNVSTGPIKFNVDNHYPILTINSPHHGMIVYGVVEVNVSVVDTFPKSTEYNIDGSGWVPVTVKWNTTTTHDGNHNITIRTVDMLGHITQQTIIVTVDNNPPTCTITSPAETEFIEGVYTFRVIAKDSVGINRVTLTLSWAPNKPVSAAYNILTGYYEYSVNTVTWTEDGWQNVTAVAYDYVNRKNIAGPINFRVDNNPPVLTIKYPKNGIFVSGNITIEANSTDAFPGPLKYNIDGSGWVPTSIPWNTNLVVDGEHIVTIKASDQSGHFTQESMKVFVDNEYPVCSVVSPTKNEFIEGTYTFRITAFDSVEVDHVLIHVFNKTTRIEYNSQTGYYEFTTNTFMYDDDTYELTATVHDTSGKNTTTTKLRFHVDNTYPKLEIITPIECEIVSDEIKINVTAEDMFINKIEYSVDNSGWKDINQVWDTTTATDGKHVISVRCSDLANHVTLQKLSVIVDNTVPKVSIVYPTENSYVRDANIVKVYADDGIGIAKVTISVDASSPIEIPKSTVGNYYEYTLDTTSLIDGEHTIVVTAIDFVGHKSTSMIRIFTDNSAPEVNVDYTREGVEKESGRVVFTATVKDNSGIRIVLLNIDNTGWREMIRVDNTTYRYEWPTTEQVSGVHIYQIKVVDVLGNEVVKMGNIHVEHEVPPDYLRAVLDILPLAVFIFFVILFIFVVFFKRHTGRWLWEPKRIKEKDEDKEKEKTTGKNTKIKS
jgi:hypothetical protein